MSYHIYTTEGIILKRQVFGEADILLHILTKEFGLIMASARSARLQASKLKGSLQEYQHISVSCVTGKNGWRITNVGDLGSYFFNYPEAHRRILAQISDLLMKMISGELTHPEVFETVDSGFEFLQNLPEKNLADFEALLVLRILYELGYVAKSEEIHIFIKNISDWRQELVELAGEKKTVIVGLINKAIKESHL